MLFAPFQKWKVFASTTGLVACAVALGACGSKADTSLLGTFRMGEKVQIGQLTYTVLESEWKNSLSDAGAGRAPQNRFLILRINCTNNGNSVATIPTLELQAADKRTYTE